MKPVPSCRLAAAFALALLCLSQAANAQVKWKDGILTDNNGVPLFVSEAEPPGVSQCYDACLNIWLPYKASPNSKSTDELTIIKRKDGVLQWAFRGKALYHWFNFKKPMDGQGMRGGNWHVIKQS